MKGWATPHRSCGTDLIFLTTAIEQEEIEGASAPEHSFGGQPFKHPMAMGSNKKHTMKVIAVEAGSGKVAWSQTAYSGRVFDDRHSGSSYASPTPVTDGERVYAYFGSEGVFAYDFEGRQIWSHDIGDIKTVGLGVGTSPVLFENLVIIVADEDSGDDSFIVALDKTTGKEIWRTDRDVQCSWSTPVVVEHDGKNYLLASGNELIIAYDPMTGKEIWRVKGLENNAIHTPMVIDDLAIFSSGYPSKKIVAVRLTGSGDRGEDYVWQYTKGAAYVPSNLLHDGLLYLTNDGGVITCLDARTGEVVYEGGRAPIRGRYTASMVAAGNRILMVNEDGEMVSIKAGKTHEILGTGSFDEPVHATPAIANDRLYVRARKHLYALEGGG